MAADIRLRPQAAVLVANDEQRFARQLVGEIVAANSSAMIYLPMTSGEIGGDRMFKGRQFDRW
jgi:hypothetical protein